MKNLMKNLKIGFFKLETSKFFVVVYFSFKAQKIEVVIKIHMHLNFIDPKIKIFRDFWVFVLSPIPKNENPKITEILQKGHNTEM